MTTFQDLGVSAPILKALDAEGYLRTGYANPTPVLRVGLERTSAVLRSLGA